MGLSSLFELKQKIAFHQPSRVKDANELRRLLAERKILPFEFNGQASLDLTRLVGRDLAEHIAFAAEGEQTGEQVLIVQPFPVHTIGSFMKETADLSAHKQYMISCGSVVHKLFELGELTETELSHAVAYLNLRELEWPDLVVISTNATLVLDDVTVSYFEHLDLLGKLSVAGFKVFVSRRQVDESSALIAHDRQSVKLLDIIDNLRKRLRDAIRSEKVKLQALPPNDENFDSDADVGDMKSHPTLALLRAQNPVDCILFDDRYFNRLAFLDVDSKQVPISNSILLLAAYQRDGRISQQQYKSAVTTLRRAGYVFVPIREGDISVNLSWHRQKVSNRGVTAFRQAI